MLSKEQKDWLSRIPALGGALQLDSGSQGDTPGGTTGNAERGSGVQQESLVATTAKATAATATPAKPSHPARPQHTAHKASKASGAGLTLLDVDALTENLAYLARPEFRRRIGQSGPAKLNLSGNPAIAAPLEKAAMTVQLWADPKTIAQAAASWRAAEPGLRALLKEAATGPLKIEPAKLKPGYDAIDAIVDWLSDAEADANIKAAQSTMAQPRPAEALDKGEFAKLEPVIKAWEKVLGSGGPIVKGKNVDDLRQVIDAWNSSRDYEARMKALEKVGALRGGRMGVLDISELGAKIIHSALAAASDINEAGKVVATMQASKGVAEAEEALHAMEGRAKLMKGVGSIATAVGLGISTYELVEGIAKGDWKKIASGSFGIGMTGLSVAAGEGAGGLLAGIEVSVWATAKAVLMGAEMAHWFHKEQELDAFKRMAHDALALIPNGMELTAAWNLLVDSQDGNDESLTASNRARYEQIAKADGAKLGKGLRALLDNHFQKNDKNAIGGYPEIVSPVLPILKPAYAAIDYDNPGTLVDAFEATMKAVKAILDAEAKSNENAQVVEKAEE